MNMKRIIICLMCVVFIPKILYSQEIMKKQFFLSGYYELLSAFPAGLRNPNNYGIINERSDINLMRQKIHLDGEYFISDKISFKGQLRFFHNATDDVGNNIPEFDAFPRDFRGNGSLLRAGDNDGMVELRELYGDINIGNWWLRIGKQQAAWGESLGMRILDQINPLDISEQFIGYRIYEEFDNVRIPQWMIRGAYKLPNTIVPDLSLEFILNPGDIVPTILPVQGSPYNIVPTFVTIKEDVPRGHPIYGGRIEGTINNFHLTLNALSKPVDDPVLKFKDAVFDPIKGLPIPTPFGFVPLRFINEGKHPRTFMLGGSFSYFQEATGFVWHGEINCIFDKPFQSAIDRAGIDRRKVVDVFLGIDKRFYLFPVPDSLLVGFQFRETATEGNSQTILNSAGTNPQSNQEIFSIFLQQPLHHKEIYPEIFFMADRNGAYWIQSGVHYEPGTLFRFNAYYNHFAGSEKRPGRLGSFEWANEFFFKITFGFAL